MIDRAHDLPITKQAAALTISRASVYYLPRPVSAADLALMRWIDELHLESGSRLMRHLLPRGARSAVGCHDSDRGALWPSPYDQARVWSQGLSVSAARCSDHATEPGLSDGSGRNSTYRPVQISETSSLHADLLFVAQRRRGVFAKLAKR
jgi:hypothetical protein